MILQRQGRIGFYGACTGQEAPPIGTVAALRPPDPAMRWWNALGRAGLAVDRSFIPQVLPSQVLVEGGIQTDQSVYGDHHILLFDSDNCRLWETFHSYMAGAGFEILGRRDHLAPFGQVPLIGVRDAGLVEIQRGEHAEGGRGRAQGEVTAQGGDVRRRLPGPRP